MFNIGLSEMLIIGVIALVFIGPKELPEIARVVGRFLNELKRTAGDLQSSLMKPQEKFRAEMDKLMEPIKPPEFGHKDEQDPLITPKKTEEESKTPVGGDKA